MLMEQVKLAVEELLRLEVPRTDSAARSREALPNVHQKDVETTLDKAAKFRSTIERQGWGVALKSRAGLIDRETAPGTPFDDARRNFLALFQGEADLPLEPPFESVCQLRDEFNCYSDFPGRLAILADQTEEYRRMFAMADAACIPRARQPKSIPPHLVCEVWASQLDRLRTLAQRERAWGSHLIELCYISRHPGHGDRGMRKWLARRMQNLREIIPAIQDAALDLMNNAPTRHSLDFRTIYWFGSVHKFSKTQAACVKVLWDAWDNGTPDVGQAAILSEIRSASARLQDIFKNHKTWKDLIVTVQPGVFRLKQPS